MRRIAPLLCLAALLLLFAAPARAERRTALVIGNGAYKDAPLKNPVNDARDMAATLKRLGFETTLLTDATMQQMETAVREFGLKLRQGGMGLFYYAGHGVQVAGNNYLVPVKAVIQTESDVKYGCLDAGLVLGKMEDAGNGLNIVILDACRNNPFARSFRSAEQGLAKMDAPTGSLIAYATSPGKTAADGEGKNGLYTQHLLKNIATSGLSVEELFKRVRQGVAGDSAKRQVPWEASSLIGQFSFAGGVQTASLGQSVQASAPVDLAAEKKRVTEEAERLKREQQELTQLQALQAEKVRLGVERQKIEQAKLLAMAAGPKTQPAAAVRSSLGPYEPDTPTAPKPGTLWKEPTTGMEFVWVPGGCFKMGSPVYEDGRKANEGPEHEVCVSGFWMGRYAVTNAEFRKLKPSHDSGAVTMFTLFLGKESVNGDQQPVVSVTWEVAQAYAQWLSTKGNGKFRLPTEAEWEYAARAGTTTARFWGENLSDVCKYENVHDVTFNRSNYTVSHQPEYFFDCSDGYAVSAPVGKFKPNPFGLYDMLGNVEQLCEDVYDENAYSFPQRDNPLFSGEGKSRVSRGGGWRGAPRDVRAASRSIWLPINFADALGFRLVRTP